MEYKPIAKRVGTTRPVTINIRKEVMDDFKAYCMRNAYLISRKIEAMMIDTLIIDQMRNAHNVESPKDTEEMGKTDLGPEEEILCEDAKEYVLLDDQDGTN